MLVGVETLLDFSLGCVLYWKWVVVNKEKIEFGFCGDCLYANFSFVVCDRMLRVVWINKKWVKVLVILL